MLTFSEFVNFVEDYNRYRVEIFRVYYFSNGPPNDISFILVAEKFIILTCLSELSEEKIELIGFFGFSRRW